MTATTWTRSGTDSRQISRTRARMADGYGWLIENCGQPSMREHAAHLDDDYHDPGCSHCERHEGCDHPNRTTVLEGRDDAGGAD